MLKLLLPKDVSPITYKTAKLIVLFPILASAFVALSIYVPATRSFGFSILKENHIVELLTFAVFLIAGVYGLIHSLKHAEKLRLATTAFYSIFSVFLILIAMEEIAWGQWFFKFDTPEDWIKINVQKETTLHNLEGMQGNTEFLRLIFGIGGLTGIHVRNVKPFKPIGVHPILTIWFLIITIHASIDIYADFVFVSKYFDLILTLTSEFIELLIAGSAFLYLWLNFNVLKKYNRTQQ